MFSYDNVHTVTVVISDPGADSTPMIFRVPARYDKIEILRAWAQSDTTVTLGNGTGIALTLLDYGVAGTANSGTISAILGGTTVTWTANQPKSFTISDGTLEGDHYLALKYDESGTIAPKNITVSFDYVSGVGA